MAPTAEAILLYIFVLAVNFPDVMTVEYCTLTTYCEDGYYCCDHNTRCCSDNILTIGAIIGIVIGCIVFISCVVAVICCFTKHSHRKGQVIHPVQPAGVAIISTGQQQGPPAGYSQPGYSQPMYGQPPMYGHQPHAQQQFGAQPPPSNEKAGTSNPAYPPPPPPNY